MSGNAVRLEIHIGKALIVPGVADHFDLKKVIKLFFHKCFKNYSKEEAL